MKTSMIALVGLFLPIVGCAMAQQPAEIQPSISVSPQPAGAVLTVDAASIPVDGWLVIHATKDGKPVVPASIGNAPLKAGMTKNIVVQLSEPTKPGDTVITMLHTDTSVIATYEFGPGSVEEDTPIIVDGKPVVKPLAIQ